MGSGMAGHVWQWLLSWHRWRAGAHLSPNPRAIHNLMTVLVTLSALCCSSWIDNGEGEIVVWGLFKGLAGLGLVSVGYVIKLQVYVIKYTVMLQWI